MAHINEETTLFINGQEKRTFAKSHETTLEKITNFYNKKGFSVRTYAEGNRLVFVHVTEDRCANSFYEHCYSLA